MVSAIFWSAWWMLGSTFLEAGLRLWLDERRAEGWVAEAGPIEVTGYPLDFSTRIDGLDLADPETGLAWTAPGFSFVSRAWNPVNVSAVWPSEQVIATPEERITVTSQGMRAALVLVPGPSLALSSASADLDAAELVSTAGWRTRVEEARLSAARTEGRENHLDLLAHAARVEPSAPVLAFVDPGGRLPRTVDLVSVDATVGFDAPWDRYAVERRRPQPRAIDLRRFKLTWGQLDLEAAGDLAVDEDGVPTGEIQVRAVNWREMLALAEAAGLLPPEARGPVERGLELLAQAAGNPTTLELPLTFAGGFVRIGPVPVGPAPRIAIR